MQIKAISAYQLPPRRLLEYIIGGLTVLEAFLLSVWIVLHAVMFWNWYTTYTKGYDYGKQHRSLACKNMQCTDRLLLTGYELFL